VPLPVVHCPLSIIHYSVALPSPPHLGIVKQHGRKSGYSLVPEMQIDSITTAAWAELTQWQG